ncbi:MAG: aldehyde dehydrogenase family protein [Pseudomonadota bacterium]
MEIASRYQLYIDGAWCDGGGGWLSVEDPATAEPLAEQALADAADVDRAVAAARACHQSRVLTAMRPLDRGRMVQRMADFMRANAEDIAVLLSREQGKPLWEARGEVENAAKYFEYFGNQASTIEGKSIPLGAGYVDYTLLEPYGVSAQIIPWNFPLEIAARSIACGIATGNACVVKSSEITPLSASFLARAGEAVGLPRGALNVISGLGPVAGAALAAHPGVDQIVFTGSVPTGQAIAAAAARNIVPCILELGGKSAAVVHEDADLDAVVASVRRGVYVNAGQICSAMSRIVAHRSIHDDLAERIIAMAQAIPVGPGAAFDAPLSGMGPMVSAAQCERAHGLVTRAEEAGAHVATGGRRLNRPGHFMEPTLITGADPDAEIAQTEVFGPVTVLMPYSDDTQAIEIANSTEYGLVAGVFTRDLDRAAHAAQALRAGQIFVNEWFAGGVETPFGGYGKSGYGREKGREALWNYVQTKNVGIRVSS